MNYINENRGSKIPEEIMFYLNEIAERLWSGHAAIMVGSGFSKNAKKSESTNKNFPDWAQLGDIFYEKIYGKKPNEKQRYLNALKLADEIQAAFGRPILDQILRSHIPDKEYEPSELHVKLLELPWTDVFTTNYDTLLERSCSNVISQKFDVVICKEDLVYSEKPRIIKLHGSFPSDRPFVITEEDYRKYPKDFAPFVNTVQQALLENTLCLVGFSGDDPNFLQWIGWIQDNLGRENSPKIYMIGIFNLSHAQKKLLEQRNIVLLDLSVCEDVKDSHVQALNLFLDFLFSAKKAGDNLNWPKMEPLTSRLSSEDSVEEMALVVKEWRVTRESYPNWTILPKDRRNVLWLSTKHIMSFFYRLSEADAPFDIQFLYEYNWRLEKCLYPITDQHIKSYEMILNRYNPFPDIFSKDQAIDPSKVDYISLPWQEIKRYWLEIQFSVMRYYREEGMFDKWNSVNDIFQELYKSLLPEFVARLHYERCLFALFSLKITELKIRLKEWPTNHSLPMWEAKRAGLIAEIGDIEAAQKLLEYSLNNIRKRLNLSPISNNYLLISQESYVMQLLQFVNMAAYGQSAEEDIDKIKDRFSERWNILKQYKCDPWNEQELFNNRLESPPTVLYGGKAIKKEFDIGRISQKINFGRADEEALTAYSYLRYREEVGIPFRIGTVTFGLKAAKGAVKRIAKYSSFWAFVLLVRIGDTKVVDAVFDRESIAKLDVSYVDFLIDYYLAAIENALPEISFGNVFIKDNFGVLLSSILPDVLSRLCVKCSDNARSKILAFLAQIYSFDQKHKFQGIYKLTERLISSYSEKQQYELLPKFLEFPIQSTDNDIIRREFPEPFLFLTFSKEVRHDCDTINIDHSVIDKLINSVVGKPAVREIAANRLGKLYEVDLLNDEQSKEFADALWSQKDPESGLPSHTSFYKDVFLNLPYPASEKPDMLFKGNILNGCLPIQKKRQSSGISLTRGDIPIVIEIERGSKRLPFNKTGVIWTENEANTILKKLLEWWDSDKQYLKRDREEYWFGSISDEFRSRFRHLVIIIALAIAPQLSDSSSKITKESLLRLFKEVSDHNIPVLRARAACALIFNKDMSDMYNDILSALSSKDNSCIVDALNAILELLAIEGESNASSDSMDKILRHLSQMILWRRHDGLVSVINTMAFITMNFPRFLNEQLLSDVLIGLQYLCDESNPSNENSEMDVADLLSLRRSAANLAFRLFQFYTEKNVIVPQTILQWRGICLDENEFTEIKNQWRESN
ncbi:SIR2 family protein [Paenibacillus macerans]|uniref:SIR2 family protein n=1 Tax=Paenibacillus macerans TaxID=44252 RepID=A0A6N8EXT7_PAEMA|nr:anti-phage defense-associated sirtuin Dsr2 [Paenibacillus macerans]MUG23252.1 SIR2 family protein [Paenibacillus macerans]